MSEYGEDKINKNIRHSYKAIPICGAIIKNAARDKVLLVLSTDTKMWGLPKGKINEEEGSYECALREIEE